MSAPHTPTPPDLSLAGPLTLEWQGDSANGFDVYFGPTLPPPLVGSTMANVWVVPTLTDGVQYFWRVLARDIPISIVAPHRG